MQHAPSRAPITRVALLGNHLPRRCGIATFTTDLANAIALELPDVDCSVLAMNDAGKTHAYSDRVRFEIAEAEIASYRRAADFVNVNEIDVVSLQHEYGIFGGKAGAHVLAFLRELNAPVVTTLHTILPEPSTSQRAVMDEIVARSERFVVMSAHGAELLGKVHGVAARKIEVIPHGIPSVAPNPRSKDRLGVEGKSVILTFGLLSPDKGIEHVIDALPAIVRRIPDAIYIVLGATHPHVKEKHGEAYRSSLERRAQELGVEANVVFHDRFVSSSELAEFLAAADIYVTPYLNADQITSGTLAYAVGASKAVISTPYSHARELLADDRGVLVPWRDPGAIAREVIELFTNEAKRTAMSARAGEFARTMFWPVAARRYYEVFGAARAEFTDRRRSILRAKTRGARPADLPDSKLDHLRAMTDSAGILQHAVFSIPRYEDGYCVDDNARALLVATLVEDAGAEDPREARALSSRYLAFVSHAFNRERGRFRNFMSFDRRWLEETGSEDSHGRALWALGAVVGRATDPGRRSLGGDLFKAALPAVVEFTSPRAWAFTLLGVDEYLHAFQGDSGVESLRATLARRLLDIHRRTRTRDWPWFEESLTYENARLSQALLTSGAWMKNDEMKSVALESLGWLASVQRSDAGHFAPVGSNGFYRRGGPRAELDQQPVEACAMVSACLEARRVTGEERWIDHARRAFAWFLGQNHLHEPLYDAATGGCRDGLHAERVNENQGAESTLSFQLALLEMRAVELTPVVRLVQQAVSR